MLSILAPQNEWQCKIFSLTYLHQNFDKIPMWKPGKDLAPIWVEFGTLSINGSSKCVKKHLWSQRDSQHFVSRSCIWIVIMYSGAGLQVKWPAAVPNPDFLWWLTWCTWIPNLIPLGKIFMPGPKSRLESRGFLMPTTILSMAMWTSSGCSGLPKHVLIGNHKLALV